MTTHTLELRPALDPDRDGPLIEQLADLLIDATDTGGSVGFLPPLERTAARAYWRDLALRPRGACVIARAGERVDGVVLLCPAWAPNQTHRADISKLLVHQRARGAGLGRQLMETVTAHARAQGFRLLVLDTKRDDTADRLYRRLGWRVAGVIPDYAIYGNGYCDTVVFYLPLG